MRKICEYCNTGTEWLVYSTKRDNGIMACTNHLKEAVKTIKDRSESNDIICLEPVSP